MVGIEGVTTMSDIDPASSVPSNACAVLNYRQISRNARMNGVYGCWMVGCVRLNVV